MITHMYGLAVYVKVELPFALENNFDSYLCFQQTLLYSLPYFFFSINHLFCICAWLLILFCLT